MPPSPGVCVHFPGRGITLHTHLLFRSMQPIRLLWGTNMRYAVAFPKPGYAAFNAMCGPFASIAAIHAQPCLAPPIAVPNFDGWTLTAQQITKPICPAGPVVTGISVACECAR